MAFAAAPGWGNLPAGNWSPVIYSKQVQLAFRKSSVAEAITNNDYFGEIANVGDSVKLRLKTSTTATSLWWLTSRPTSRSRWTTSNLRSRM
jgi:hypothetical protein